MQEKKSIKNWLRNQPAIVLSLWCIAAAFTTYFSMYAFRKPFTAAMYEDMELWNVQYKVILIISQVAGYTASKFLGIKYVSEMPAAKRALTILALMGFCWLTLLGLGLVPYPYNFLFMFLNGLPLGMIWGLTFAFLEGRQHTELLAAGMASSFIVGSGFVKTIGLEVMLSGVGEFWMPFLTGAFFIPTLFLGVWMLTKIPAPSAEDEQYRAKRVPMNRQERIAFFKSFAPGIVLVTIIYVAINAYRDFRDNFAVEIWAALGYAEQPEMLTYSEVPIALLVLVIVSMMIFLKNNRTAFYSNMVAIFLGGVIVLSTTWLFQQGQLNPAIWMIAVGFGMYLPYIAYHTVLFERWIAHFHYVSNIAFLMYIADSFGYLGSVGVMLFQNFFFAELSWLSFFVEISYGMGILCCVLSIGAWFYFRRRERKSPVAVGQVQV